MSLTLDELKVAADALPPAQRDEFSDYLQMPNEIAEETQSVREVWTNEIRRRRAEVEAGTAKTYPVEDTFHCKPGVVS